MDKYVAIMVDSDSDLVELNKRFEAGYRPYNDYDFGNKKVFVLHKHIRTSSVRDREEQTSEPAYSGSALGSIYR